MILHYDGKISILFSVLLFLIQIIGQENEVVSIEH